MALEQRDGHLNAVYRCDKLVSVLRRSETPGQDPNHPSALIHATINLDPLPPGSGLRLRLAGRSVLFTFILSRCSRLHGAADGYSLVAVAGDAQRCWRGIWSVDDEVRKVCFCLSRRLVYAQTLTSLQIWSCAVDRICVLAARSRPESQLLTHSSGLGRGDNAYHRGNRHRLRAPAWLVPREMVPSCYYCTDHAEALVALQALCRPQDRAVATSTRNLMRMLGAVTGLAVSTAVQYAVTNSALGSVSELSSLQTADVLAEAKMKGIRAVFIIMVPLIAMCGLSCFFVPNTALLGDERQVGEREAPARRE